MKERKPPVRRKPEQREVIAQAVIDGMAVKVYPVSKLVKLSVFRLGHLLAGSGLIRRLPKATRAHGKR
jgi:hypothetical protein